MTTYHVWNEHTLLYKQEGELPGIYGIMAGKPQLGGYDWMDGVCAPDETKLRPATLDDFHFFRVCPKGHLT